MVDQHQKMTWHPNLTDCKNFTLDLKHLRFCFFLALISGSFKSINMTNLLSKEDFVSDHKLYKRDATRLEALTPAASPFLWLSSKHFNEFSSVLFPSTQLSVSILLACTMWKSCICSIYLLCLMLLMETCLWGFFPFLLGLCSNVLWTWILGFL